MNIILEDLNLVILMLTTKIARDNKKNYKFRFASIFKNPAQFTSELASALNVDCTTVTKHLLKIDL